MDIEYDPTEEQADDVDAVLDYDRRRDQWLIACSEHGEIERAPDGSAQSHNEMIYRWVQHMQEEHHGDGQLTPDERSMLIPPEQML